MTLLDSIADYIGKIAMPRFVGPHLGYRVVGAANDNPRPADR